MCWRTTVAAVAAAALPFMCLADDEAIGIGTFDASFVQIGCGQRGYDEARWTRELRVLHDLGVGLVILQFSGDEDGPYDHGSRRPVAALLAAAGELDMQVFVGLHDDPLWPRPTALQRLAPPLDDPDAARALGELCTHASACAGWYISQEIDDRTWSSPALTAQLRAHVARTARALRELAPGKPVAIAPFFTGARPPVEHARWWLDVLEPGAIDVLILQDGVGTGRATPEQAGAYLAALRPALQAHGVALWSVAELFHQRHGPPIDDEPFDAVPIDPATLRHSLAIEHPLVERVVAFAVLDYMDPRRGGAARRLHDDYATRCRVARSSRRTPC